MMGLTEKQFDRVCKQFLFMIIAWIFCVFSFGFLIGTTWLALAGKLN